MTYLDPFFRSNWKKLRNYLEGCQHTITSKHRWRRVVLTSTDYENSKSHYTSCHTSYSTLLNKGLGTSVCHSHFFCYIPFLDKAKLLCAVQRRCFDFSISWKVTFLFLLFYRHQTQKRLLKCHFKSNLQSDVFGFIYIKIDMTMTTIHPVVYKALTLECRSCA